MKNGIPLQFLRYFWPLKLFLPYIENLIYSHINIKPCLIQGLNTESPRIILVSHLDRIYFIKRSNLRCLELFPLNNENFKLKLKNPGLKFGFSFVAGGVGGGRGVSTPLDVMLC